MVVARSGGYRARRQQQRQTPGQWVADQGLSMQDVVAFGDNYNDLSMLEAAGTGVAMGNAVDEVKARANIVIGDNESTSIAEFIYRQLL
ncbi:phosphatase [Klebsiella pneumoniae]|uniref:Phosphatase n=1 Tax=Klebsiella pneumoniae TaxID=573 RepID=A0A2X3I803_KLEPN|nr:phosphatase [Klebsiella pneumoniae]